jgi:hypothetical protein
MSAMAVLFIEPDAIAEWIAFATTSAHSLCRFEHHPRESQVTSHAQARQMPKPCGITNPRDPHVQQRRRRFAVKQRLAQRHHPAIALNTRRPALRARNLIPHPGAGSARSLIQSRHL